MAKAKNIARVSMKQDIEYSKKLMRIIKTITFASKVRGLKSTLIPPCWKSLEQKMLRTNYINSMFQNVTETRCEKLPPEDCGWFVEYCDGNPILKPTWFFGDALPSTINDILQEEASNSNSDEANAIVENNTDNDLHDYADFSENDSSDELFDE